MPGFEVTFNSATNDALGFGKKVLAPMLFAGFPGLLGKKSLFIPGYQYLFRVGGDENRPDVSRSQIDLYFVWLLPKGGNWLIVNPQILADRVQVLALTDLMYGFLNSDSSLSGDNPQEFLL